MVVHHSCFSPLLLQGLIHLGKGTLTLNPYHSDRALMTPVAVAGLLTVLLSLLDASNSKLVSSSGPDLWWVASSPDLPSGWVPLVLLLNRHHLAALSPPAVILKDGHYVLFYLTPAIQPRMLVTYDEDLSPLLVNVRVGQVRNKFVASNDDEITNWGI